jgi:hypothetical protein
MSPKKDPFCGERKEKERWEEQESIDDNKGIFTCCSV